MGLFGGDDKSEKNAHRGGFEDKDFFDHSSAKYCTRIIDEEAEVVLYGAFFGTGFGLTAVPLKDTALELPEASENAEE